MPSLTPGPGLVLGIIVVLIAAQLTRLIVPGHGPYLWTLLLAAAGFAAAELVAGSRPAGPSVGVIHPVADVLAIGFLELVGGLLVSVMRRGGREP